jgi:hypothetical protein
MSGRAAWSVVMTRRPCTNFFVTSGPASVTWGIDLTSRARSDLVGLDREVREEIDDLLMACAEVGPPHENGRLIAGVLVYECVIAGRFLLGCVVNEGPPSLALRWLRRRPPGAT